MTTFSEYQAKAGETAVYPDCGQGTATALMYVGLGLGEVGEVQGKIKKIVRDDGGVLLPEKAEAIAGEIGDALWYLARLSTEMGWSLEEIALRNLAKLADRQARGVLTGSGDNR